MIKSAFPVTYQYLELMVLNNKLEKVLQQKPYIHEWKNNQGVQTNMPSLWSSWYNPISPMIQFCTKV